MTKIDLEALKVKKGVRLKELQLWDKLINRGTLVALWILAGLLIGTFFGFILGQAL